MASVKLTLDTRKPKKDGTFPLKLSITHNKWTSISTGIYLKEDNFLNGEVVNCKGYKALNNMAQTILFNAQKVIFDCRLSGKLNSMTVAQLKTLISNSMGNYTEPEETTYLVKEHFQKFIDSKNNPRTKEIYQYTLNKIGEFCDIENLNFENITFAWLKSFDTFMSKTCSTNARAIHLRNIRAVFNDAIDYEFISQNIYPFRKFKIKKEKTAKRSIIVEKLTEFYLYPCEEHQERYRDIFFLIFYLIGINIIDLLHLKHADLINGRIEYKRAKTGRLYSIELLPEAIELIEKYKGEKYLLNIMDTYTDYKNFAKRLNMSIKKIGPVEILKHGKKNTTGIIPQISTYYARHTWASIASYLEIPKETIGASLGHSDNTVTDIYIDFDRKKIDEANRKVIEFFKSYVFIYVLLDAFNSLAIKINSKT